VTRKLTRNVAAKRGLTFARRDQADPRLIGYFLSSAVVGVLYATVSPSAGFGYRRSS